MIKSISMVLPAKNEEKKIRETILACYGVLKSKKIPFEIIVVVNGSTDSTAKIVKGLSKKIKELCLIEERKQVLKGGAVEIGFKKAKHDCTGFMDSDNTFSRASILKIIDAFEKNDASAVIARKTYRSLTRKLLSKGLSVITIILFGLHDTQTGLKLFKKKDLLETLPLKEKGWIFDLEILWKLKKAGKKIVYIPIELKNNSEGGFSKRDIIKMLFGLARLRLFG
jgi:glycosyltransferase involved in cell wall biosynthesis